MKTKTIILVVTGLIAFSLIHAQDIPVHPSSVITGTYYGLSRPLREIPPMTAEEFAAIEKKALQKQFNEGLKYRNYPFAETALPKGDDPAWQKTMGMTDVKRSPVANFEGQVSPYYPPDPNGSIDQEYFMQTVNCVYAIYDKSGTLVAGPTNLNLLFGNVPGANRNDGDPITLFDEQAGRWLVTEFSVPESGPNYILIAVSATSDPTGSWHQYSFQLDVMPDYPKFGVWRDGYYMGDNNSGGKDIYVFERDQLLNGENAQAVGFNNLWRPSSSDGFMCVPPLDNDGVFAPAGSPGLYIAFNDDALGSGSDELWIYELNVDWANPIASTFTRTQQLEVQPFNADFGPTWDNIVQPGTSQKLDAIPQVIMNAPQYRNFGTYQTIVCCHTVKVNDNGLAGIRWYELRKTTGNWSVRQQGTYAPDNQSRWMGSIRLNGSSKLALGYSVSSSSVYPSIRYCGQSPAGFENATGILDIPEESIFEGAHSQQGANRWGDYTLMSVDPLDDETFWFTDQYIGSGGSRRTRIASFRFGTGPIAITLAATGITNNSAILNASVNPQGSSTTYYFRYGTDSGNLNDSTEAASAGSGSEPVSVNTGIQGLTDNQVYYFLVVARSAGGVSLGDILSFVTGTPQTLSVNPPSRSVTSAAGSTEYYVTSNTSWTVTCDVAWCTMTPAGVNDGTISVNYEENLDFSDRTAHFTISTSGLPPQSVSLNQAGAEPMVLIDPPNQNVSAQAGSTLFTVTSNTDWTVHCDAGWCLVTPTGSGNGIIVANFTANQTGQVRIADISVSVNSVLYKTVTITQAKSSMGIDEATTSGLQIYPNPNKGSFRIVPPEKETGMLDVTIRDLNGQSIFQQTFHGQREYQVDLSSAPGGCYQVVVKTSTSLLVRKLVVIK